MIYGFSEFSSVFDFTRIMFTVIFVAVIVIFAVVAIKGLSQWKKNNNSPRLTVPATIVSKRTHVSRHLHNHHGTGIHHNTTSTTYYVTFQVESGDRMELHVTGREFGILIEGDHGMLTFQGTRYLSFIR